MYEFTFFDRPGSFGIDQTCDPQRYEGYEWADMLQQLASRISGGDPFVLVYEPDET